jgi:hypothetical protein
MNQLPAILTLSFLVALAASCSSGAVKPGTMTYSTLDGMLTSVEVAPYKRVIRATTEAMRRLELRPMERDRDGFRTLIVGETVFGRLSQSHELRVWITRLTESTTRIELRILGRRDEQRLRQIHGEIRAQLERRGK